MTLTQSRILAQIQDIRVASEVFLADVATLRRKTGDAFIEGVSRPIFAPDEIFPCRLITRSGSESHNIAAQAREIQQSTFTGLYRMQVPYTLDVSEQDQIVHDGKTFEVLYAPQAHIMMGARIVQMQEVK